jgi:CO dehydrogenase maturation factor
VVADPSYNALSVAKESAGLARQLGINDIILAVNRADDQTDIHRISQRMGDPGEFSGMVLLPFDPEVIQREPAVGSLLSDKSLFINEVRTLVTMINRGKSVDPGTYKG